MAVQVIQLVEEIMGNWHIKGPVSNCLILLDFLNILNSMCQGYTFCSKHLI